MSDPQLIWRFGRWIGARGTGTARLGWSGGNLVLKVRGAKAVSVEGPDPSIVSNVLGSSPAGHTDLLLEAREVAARTGADETRAIEIVKSIVEAGIRSWMLDDRRTLELIDGEISPSNGPTISLPHAIVEMVLSDETDELPETILEDRRILLRRSPGFLEGYASLQLSEEADLIAAKITGQRTANEIIDRAPQDSAQVMQLLAALVSAGFLEPVPVAGAGEEGADFEPVVLPPSPVKARRLSASLLIAAMILLAVVLIVGGWLVFHHRTGAGRASQQWGIVIDHGCQPQDLQRILEKAGKHPKRLSAQADDTTAAEPCWDLVWGAFATKAEAQAAITRVPKSLVRKGVTKHIVMVAEKNGPPADRGRR